MLLKIFTLAHVGISLAGIAAGCALLSRMLAGKWSRRGSAVFLGAMAMTDITGFLFPVHQFLPSHAVGIISLVVLSAAFYAERFRQFHGAWRKVYAIGVVAALYLDVFVALVQAFRKIPTLNALAPTQTEPPFKAAQLVALAGFVILGVATAIRFPKTPSTDGDG
jgi:hypothetical protein